MNKEFFEALECLAAECKIPLDSLVEKIEQGILKAVRREYPEGRAEEGEMLNL